MKIIKVVTDARGFLVDLFNTKIEDFEFEFSHEDYFEAIGKKKAFLSTLIKLPIFDYLGVFKVNEVGDTNADFLFSYNRFIKSKTPYVLYMENPLAPVHYSIARPKTILCKRKLAKLWSADNLLGIRCLSNACRDTLRNYYDIPSSMSVETIYPLVIPRFTVDRNVIKTKAHDEILKILYVSSVFELKGGQDILLALKKLSDKNIQLTIVTRKNTISPEDLKTIEADPRIKLLEFNLSKEELGKLYMESAILLNPTRQDSFSLVLLEAIKYGATILSTDLYAIPEMVIDGQTGFLTKPKYRFWQENKMPNPKVWNHRKETIYSSYIDENVVSFLVEKLSMLNSNRECLCSLCLNSWNHGNSGGFNEDTIKNQWAEAFQIKS